MKFTISTLIGALAGLANGRRFGNNDKWTVTMASCFDNDTTQGEGDFGVTGGAKFRQATRTGEDIGNIKIWSFWNGMADGSDVGFCIYDEVDCAMAGEGSPIELDAFEMYDAESMVTMAYSAVENGDDLNDYIDVGSLGVFDDGDLVACCNIVAYDSDWDDLADEPDSVDSVSSEDEVAPAAPRGELAPEGGDEGEGLVGAEGGRLRDDGVPSEESEDSVDSVDSISSDEGAARRLSDSESEDSVDSVDSVDSSAAARRLSDSESEDSVDSVDSSAAARRLSDSESEDSVDSVDSSAAARRLSDSESESESEESAESSEAGRLLFDQN